MEHSETAIVRTHIERIDGVSKSWFEHNFQPNIFAAILVVEVDFPTDPNSTGFRRSVLEEIENTVRDVLDNKTTAVLSGVRVVPKSAGAPQWGP
jgi:hypothetical protein